MSFDRNTPVSPSASMRSALECATQVSFSSRFVLAEGIEEFPVPIFVINHEHRIAVWNKALARLTGQGADSMLGTRDHWKAFYPCERPTLADLIVDDVLEAEVDRCYRGKYNRSPLMEGGVEVSDFFPGVGEDGRWLYFTAAPLKDSTGRVVGAIEVLQDVTTRHRAEAALRESQGFLRQIVDGSSVPTFVIDREHRLTHWNRACELITGYPEEDLVGTREQWRPFYASERPVMADLILDSVLQKEIAHFYQDKFRPSTVIQGAFEAEDFFAHLGEGGRWLFFTAAPLRDAEGDCIGAIETLQDITEKKRVEQALRESEHIYRTMSITDALTSLFNARHFYERIDVEMERASRYGRPLSILMLDLDDFKRLNDTHGHLEGDQALIAAAKAIHKSLRILDSAFRYGGEEFIVALPDTDLVAASGVAERLRQMLAAVTLTSAAGVSFGVTASIGVAEFVPAETLHSLMRRADTGMYAAKRQGKNCVVAQAFVAE